MLRPPLMGTLPPSAVAQPLYRSLANAHADIDRSWEAKGAVVSSIGASWLKNLGCEGCCHKAAPP